MKASNRTSHGPCAFSEIGKATTASQAAWRFLNNERVTLEKLIEPLREVGREGISKSRSAFALIAHDWCKLNYGRQRKNKRDLAQLTHETDIGYDLTTALLIEADEGTPLSPVQIHVKTGKEVHSTGASKPQIDDHHLDQLEPTMDESSDWNLGRQLVHIIDREADSLGRLRSWDAKGHLFLVRCDDRRVRHNGQSVLLSELNEQFHNQDSFVDVGSARFQGKKVRREVTEAAVTLYRPHSETHAGEKKSVAGPPIDVRAVFVRLVDKQGYIVAEWMLLTNVPADSVAAEEIGKWYYWRWRIESFFKLLKSHGHEIEYWQQKTGAAITRRLLVAAMACVVVNRLQQAKSAAADRFRKFLIQLSGRRMKHRVEFTAPALLAGYYAYLAMSQFIEQNQSTIEELKTLEQNVLRELKLV
jgi:hypothetical protein